MKLAVLLSVLFLSTCKNEYACKIVSNRPWKTTRWF